MRYNLVIKKNSFLQNSPNSPLRGDAFRQRGIIKNTIILGFFLLLSSCTMKPQNDKEFQELHKHKGTENYEIVKLYDKNFKMVEPFLIDKIKKDLVVYGFQEDKLNKNILKTRRISNLGEITEILDDTFNKLKDGTMWTSDYYINWVINKDTTKHKYLDPFSNKEIDDPYEFKAKETDPEKWLIKFKELYAKAQYIYIYEFLLF